MKRFLTTFFAVVAAQIFLGFAALLVLMLAASAAVGTRAGQVRVAPGSCLVQEIPGELSEYDPAPHLPLPRRPPTHTTILENLEKARLDPRIARVVLKVDVPGGGWGKWQEIRGRVRALREAGKPVYAYTTFGIHSTLYLAAACDSIVLAPEGALWLTGLMAERMYLKSMFERAGVDIQLHRLQEYKGAAEMYTRADMSPEVRENAAAVLGDLYEEFCAALARDRNVDRAAVEGWLERSPIDPAGALAEGIVDAVLYWEDLAGRLRGGGGEFASIAGHDYARVTRASLGQSGREIAVVHGQGLITTGRSGALFPLERTMGDETMVAALEQALDDDRIAGILLRLDTPGGLGLASDRIGRMVATAAARKPLVVSTVDLNASGGYMVSYRCSTIVALPGSIVGSIGAYSVRPTFAGLMDKLGVSFDRVTIGPHATAFSPVVPLSADEFGRLAEVQRRSYDRWVEGVAAHRGLTLAQVDALARGRVYTGRQALANGLIDAVGGFDEALALLKEQIGLAPEAPVTLRHYPARRGLLEELRAGEWGAAANRLAARWVRGGEEEQGVSAAVALLRRWFETQEPWLYCPWRFR